MPLNLASQERIISGNHLKADNVLNFPLAVLFWRSWFHRWIIHWLNASKHFIVLWLTFSVGSRSKNSKMVQAHLRKRSWEPCEHIISGWHQKCMCSSNMYQNMCAVAEFHSDLPLSRHWRFSIDFLIFSVTDSKWIVFRERLLNTVFHYNSCHL